MERRPMNGNTIPSSPRPDNIEKGGYQPANQPATPPPTPTGGAAYTPPPSKTK